MNRALVDQIANAVLYEGYILYPYRPSIKNRQRWTFGGLYPEAFCRANPGSDASSNQTECLIHGTPATTFEAVIRFLHLTARRMGEIQPPLPEWPQGAEPPFRPVETLRVGDKLYHTWQEAEEREVDLGRIALADVLAQPQSRPFLFPGRRQAEPVHGADGAICGIMIREQQTVAGTVEVSARSVGENLFCIRLRVLNRTPLAETEQHNREEALLRALASTHVLLGVEQGEFVSFFDPPELCREAVAACRNVGVWPVLVGTDGQRDTMLASPIILYDYPQIAPESPGNFFDGTEIDEMLTLRIMTLTDEEKRDMAGVDERGSALLARTEALAREQLSRLHGTLRHVRPVPEESAHG